MKKIISALLCVILVFTFIMPAFERRTIMSDMKENELGQMSFFDRLFVSKKVFKISFFVAVICFLYDAYVAFRYYESGKLFCIVASGVLIATLICLES